MARPNTVKHQEWARRTAGAAPDPYSRDTTRAPRRRGPKRKVVKVLAEGRAPHFWRGKPRGQRRWWKLLLECAHELTWREAVDSHGDVSARNFGSATPRAIHCRQCEATP